jgi:membrane peptidoglycan carboxypeptidase
MGAPPIGPSGTRPNGPSASQLLGSQQQPGAGATGVFPSAYAPTSDQPTRGYAPEPPPRRGRRQPPPNTPRPRRLIDYPRWGRQGWTRWLPSWKLISALIGTGIMAMIIGLFAAYSATSIPPEDAQAVAQTTVIYYNDGKTPIAQLATQNRQIVELGQIPQHVRLAVLAAEDQTFYTNKGVDPKSIARAVYSNVRGNSLQGGSTISQQYVKNMYNQRDRSYKRKAKEIFLAIKINRSLDKDLILKRYLNTIYFGRGAYGIQAAAHAYFGDDTSVEKLTVEQGAFLAGIINAPSLADPEGGPEENARAQRRWGVVLDAMVSEKLLKPATRQAMKFPKTRKQKALVGTTGQAGFLRDMAAAEAQKVLGISKDKLETGGYKIVTTFNKRMVKASADAVKKMLPKSKPKGLQIGMATVDPTSGAVRAVYGGDRYKGAENNNATIARAEAGSTFKPFGLVAALADGYSLKDKYNGKNGFRLPGPKKQGDSEDDVTITNYGDETFGYIDLVKATEDSVNTVYVKLNLDVGPDKMEEMAYKLGIPKSPPIGSNMTNVLGSFNPHPIDMASAYGTIAANGVRRSPYTVQQVTLLGTKQVLWDMKKEGRTKGKRVVDSGVMADTTYAMQAVVKNGTGECAQKLGRPAAGKTGTSSDSKSAWFAGFTPQLSTAVSMYQIGKTKKGTPTNLSMDGFGRYNSIFGGGYPCEIWTEFMEAALKNKDVEPFPEPVWGGEVTHKAPIKAAPPTPTDVPDEPDVPDNDNPPPSNEPPNSPPPTFTTPTQEAPPAPPTNRPPTPTFSLPGGPPGNNDDNNDNPDSDRNNRRQ